MLDVRRVQRSPSVQPVERGPRLLLSVLLGLIGGGAAAFYSATRTQHRDFAQIWHAAGAVLRGASPYDEIGPGLAFEWAAPFFYPLPAALLGTPFAPLPEPVAVGLFMAIGVGVLTWTLSQTGYPSLLGLGSACVINAVVVAQWSPLLAGAFVVAPLSALLVVKPTIGLALFVARPSWWAVGGAFALTAMACLLQPDWVSEWRGALGAASVGEGKAFPYSAPVTLPGGPIALLALLRWRRPEARLLAAMACVPQTLIPYEGVLLFLIPRGWIECALLVASSHLMTQWIVPYDDVDLATWIAIVGPAMTMFLYVPATVMVLLRPNRGRLPERFERAIANWPPRLRGQAQAAT